MQSAFNLTPLELNDSHFKCRYCNFNIFMKTILENQKFSFQINYPYFIDYKNNNNGKDEYVIFSYKQYKICFKHFIRFRTKHNLSINFTSLHNIIIIYIYT